MHITVNKTLCSSVEDIERVASSAFASFVKEYYNDKSYVLAHTSGSTGAPKEIKLDKEDMRQSAILTNSFFQLNHNSLFYLNLSPSYIAGKMMIVRALELNAHIIEEPSSNTPLYNYSGEHIDLAAFVPSQLIYLLENKDRLKYIKSMIIGGGKIPHNIHSEIAKMEINAYATYGMTETCSHIALSRVNKHQEEPYSALGDVSFSLDNRNCLVINAPQFKTARIVTNDIVELISNSQFRWKGRYDNMINSGGIKICPEEVESKISSLFMNKRYYISATESDKWGEELILVIEDESIDCAKKEMETDPKLIKLMKKILPSHSIPRKTITLKHFTETESGKVIREI